MASLAGKVVIITGASSGIGEGVAKHLATLCSKLCLVGRNVENLERVAKSCQETGPASTEVIIVAGDICNKSDRQNIVSQAVQKFSKLDVLVNNAGTVNYNTASNTSEEEYDEVFDTNLKSHVFLTQLAIPYLKKAKGNIVNVSSICSTKIDSQYRYIWHEQGGDRYVHGVPGFRYGTIRSSSKCYLFLEAQKGVHPLGRVGLPQDCADAIAFLASDAASFISGQSIYIDGARHFLSASVATNIMKKKECTQKGPGEKDEYLDEMKRHTLNQRSR